MSLASERYLIELGPAFLREPVYLHVHEVDGEDRADGGFEWHSDKTRALRFASRHDAEVFGHRHLDSDFFACAHPAADLVGVSDHVYEDEVFDLASC